jgi:molybdopterin-synthase adenylyltransferase
MSRDDIVAERDRLGGAVAARTNLPVLGMTLGTDGSWSARFWTRDGPKNYGRRWAANVRVVGENLRNTFHPELRPRPELMPNQIATRSVWGDDIQSEIVRAHVGIVGLGSVGSIVGESLARIGFERVTFIDHDVVEQRNLDRTLGARIEHAQLSTPKVEVAKENFMASSTASSPIVNAMQASVTREGGFAAALNCDVLISCVDRPLPRHVLNTISYSHLIPVIDGGILARVNSEGLPQNVDWRIHTVGPGKRCLVCLGALYRSDVALDRDGLFDDPDYIANLPDSERSRFERRNVFPFSMSVAAHISLQLAGLLGAGQRIGGIGPQTYHAYPGMMITRSTEQCDWECEYSSVTATALTGPQVGVNQDQVAYDAAALNFHSRTPSLKRALSPIFYILTAVRRRRSRTDPLR